MTVQNTPNTVDYTGNDAQLAFAFTFRVDDVSWVDLNFTTGFDQIILNSDQDLNPGGSVLYTVAPPTGQLVRITRITPQDQQLDYTRYDPFDSESHEDALDKLTMEIQDLQAQILLVEDGVLPVGTVDGSILRWDDTGQDWDEFFTYILPTADGNPGEAIVTDGAGSLSFGSSVVFPLLAPNGSVAAPSYSFTNDPGAGVSLNGLGSMSFSANGIEVAQVLSGTEEQFAIARSGNSAVPDLTSLSDLDTGFWWNSFNETAWMGGGSRSWWFSTAKFYSNFSNGPGLLNEISELDNPTVVPDHADPDTGLGGNGSNSVSLVAGGTIVFAASQLAGGQVLVDSQFETGIIASTTQTQGQQPLFSSYNEVTTVANPNDVVTMPVVAQGRRVVIVNNGVNDLQVFPAAGNNLGAGVNVSIVISSGNVGVFIGRNITDWDTLYNSPPNPSIVGGGQNGAKGFRTTTLPLTTDTPTIVPFTAESYDTNNFHSTVSNTSRMTVPAGVSVVELRANIQFSSYLSGGRKVWFVRNGLGPLPGQIDDFSPFLVSLEEAIAGGVNQPAAIYASTGQIQTTPGHFYEVVVESVNQTGVNVSVGSWFEIEVIA